MIRLPVFNFYLDIFFKTMHVKVIGVIFTSLVLISNITNTKTYTPVVIWHGIGDTCCNDTTTGQLQTRLWQYLPGIHVVSLKIGTSISDDLTNSYIMHPDLQVQYACNIIKSDPLLANGYNAVGFSQGSQFLRGLLQRCPVPKMKTFITMAGPHQGVYGIPKCNASFFPFCNASRELVNGIIYSRFIQKILVPATYWHNPLNNTAYVLGSSYLADINNERYINPEYVKNLQSLEKFVMVKHLADEYLQPIETSWFGYYKNGQSVSVETLEESELYKKDRLGLKEMNEQGKLYFLNNTWRHEEFVWPWFKEHIVDKYLV